MLLELDIGLSLLLHQSVAHILAHSLAPLPPLSLRYCADVQHVPFSKLLERRAQSFLNKVLISQRFRLMFVFLCLVVGLLCGTCCTRTVFFLPLFLSLSLSLSLKKCHFPFLYTYIYRWQFTCSFLKSWLVSCVKRLKSTQETFKWNTNLFPPTRPLHPSPYFHIAPTDKPTPLIRSNTLDKSSSIVGKWLLHFPSISWKMFRKFRSPLIYSVFCK